MNPAQHRLLMVMLRNPAVAAAHHAQFHSVPIAGTGMAKMTSTTPPVSGHILGPTSLRHSPITHVNKIVLVKALRGM